MELTRFACKCGDTVEDVFREELLLNESKNVSTLT